RTRLRPDPRRRTVHRPGCASQASRGELASTARRRRRPRAVAEGTAGIGRSTAPAGWRGPLLVVLAAPVGNGGDRLRRGTPIRGGATRHPRSEERRGGKGGRAGGAPTHDKG